MSGVMWRVVGGLSVAGLVWLAGCGEGGSDGGGEEGGGVGVVLVEGDTLPREIIEGDVRVELPESWTRVVPVSAMRAHQFVTEPDSDGVIATGAVFTSIGGDIDSNLARWESQLSGDVAIETERVRVGDREVAAFVGSGTFDAGRALGSTGPRDGWVVLGLIVETETSKPFVLKIDGPAALLDPNGVAWLSLVGSVQVGGESAFPVE